MLPLMLQRTIVKETGKSSEVFGSWRSSRVLPWVILACLKKPPFSF